jgi:hypothetical protein
MTGGDNCDCSERTPKLEMQINPRYSNSSSGGFADPFDKYKRDGMKHILKILNGPMKGKNKLQKIKEAVLRCL